MKVFGWFETEEGAAHVELEGRTFKDIVKDGQEHHADFGHTDMELTDEDGNDVTMAVYNAAAKMN